MKYVSISRWISIIGDWTQRGERVREKDEKGFVRTNENTKGTQESLPRTANCAVPRSRVYAKRHKSQSISVLQTSTLVLAALARWAHLPAKETVEKYRERSLPEEQMEWQEGKEESSQRSDIRSGGAFMTGLASELRSQYCNKCS